MRDRSVPEDIDDALLARLIAGEATDADLAEIRRWIEGAPERNAELAVFRELAQLAVALPSSRRVRAMWESLESRLDDADLEPEGTKRRSQPENHRRLGVVPSAKRPVWPRRLTGATHLAFALALILVVLWRTGREPPGAIADAIEMTREVRTSRGEKMRLKLIDGTQVDLGPESSLHMRYITNGPRELKLEGEAVFHVTHDPRRPFRVRSANAVTEDLGTIFGVRAYADEEVRVVVAEGVVVLRPMKAGDLAVLRAGEIGRLHMDGRIETEGGVNADGYLGWTRDRLFYQHAPLREIADDLERAYDVTIMIPDSAVAASRVTLDLKGATLAEALHAIAVPLRIRRERVGQTFVLRP